jgi:outer membrane receptor protein involved in Fe transport
LSDGVAQWELGNVGLFLQDTWAVNYNLSLVFGVRYDRASMPDSPLFNAAAAAAPGRSSTAVPPAVSVSTTATRWTAKACSSRASA